jgi:myo-inositol 2-dehydrogenase/D-chiro-inositol 1-dehydrogenase
MVHWVQPEAAFAATLDPARGTVLKIGLIGAGRIGTFHAQTLSSAPGVKSLWIMDADPARAKSVAAAVGAHTAPDAAALARKVDALVIATAADSHADMIVLGAEAGLPVFCEKPISLDLDATDRVLDAIARTGVALQIGFQRRFDPGFVEARRMVASGELGQLYAARLATHDPEPAAPPILRASGGIFRDLMVHDFDIIRWTSGLEVVEVYATGSVLTGNKEFARLGDVDTAVVVLRLSGGPMAVVTGLRHNPRGYDVRLELFGSRDSVVTGMDSRAPLRPLGDHADSGDEGEYEGFLDRFGSAYRDELHAFLRVARGEIDSPCSGEEAREGLRVSLAAMRSMEERRPVALDEIK